MAHLRLALDQVLNDDETGDATKALEYLALGLAEFFGVHALGVARVHIDLNDDIIREYEVK
jgi:hypothetical protein